MTADVSRYIQMEGAALWLVPFAVAQFVAATGKWPLFPFVALLATGAAILRCLANEIYLELPG